MSLVYAVAYAEFDLHIGNRIAATCPEECSLDQFCAPNLADYCFPDGAHQHNTDCVSITLRLRESSSVMFGCACYHRKTDPSAERGAFQRSILFLSYAPLFCAFRAVAKAVIFPFLDKQLPDVEITRVFIRNVYDSLIAALVGRVAQPLSDCATMSIEGRDIPLIFPRASASDEAHVSHGASLRCLITPFGQSLANIYWAMVKRWPVLFVGPSAAVVGEAVCAFIHLARPIDLGITRIAPYVTISQMDEVVGRISEAPCAVFGATNAFILHKDFAGVVKCNLEDGAIIFPGNKPLRAPRAIQAHFNDLHLKAQDAHVSEVYLRALATKANLVLQAQFEKKQGHLYDLLAKQTNFVEVQADCSERFATLDEDQEFLLVGDTTPSLSPSTTPLIPSPFVHQNVSFGTSEFATSFAAAVEVYEVSFSKNSAILKEFQNWYKTVLQILKPIVTASDQPQQQLFEELKAFDPKSEQWNDESLHACPSELIATLVAQEKSDRVLRLRVASELKERLFLLVDALQRGNAPALQRKANLQFGDYFNFNSCAAYNMRSQVLLHESSCGLAVVDVKAANKSYATRGKL